MSRVKILECTLRDGGYITDWNFDNKCIEDTINALVESNLDYIEVGYLNINGKSSNSTQFISIEKIENFIPKNRRNSMILAMADVTQFGPEDVTPYTGKSVDAIRVVFYKHQIEEAFRLANAIKQAGYKLFMQPMVTIDYSVEEYTNLVRRLAKLKPYGVAIVDSFGYMMKADFRTYFSILDDNLPPKTVIGFHSHNNMNLAFITAQDVFEYITDRELVIDSTLYGMGRGAGNLQTELITNYYNSILNNKYNLSKILYLIGKYIIPIRNQKKWGYSPYLLITALYHCHPNFACYLLNERSNVEINDFERYIASIPYEMKTKCKKPYVLELWDSMH